MNETKKLKEEIQDLIAQRQKQTRRTITCWRCGESDHLRSSFPRINKDRSNKCWRCGGTGHLSNCPRVHQEDPPRASVIESKKVCSHRKGSAHGNADTLSRRPCPESCKYCFRIEKKFGMKDSVVHKVTTPSTSESDPWNDESVRKDQLADPEIKSQ
ncbi:gag-pol [Trichonephila clavipes]|nr:gag-pol [Trichonephila clavipes]